jgi:argininosuccinate synthase
MKIVLAYSGGLDTSVMVRWLKEHYKAKVIAYCAQLGQLKDEGRIRERALSAGADSVFVEDVREEFLKEYVLPALRAGAEYGGYLLSAALSRPLIAKKLVQIARREGADCVGHGATAKGNDQVRFEVSIRALAPNMKIIAPARIWEFKTREEEIEYARRWGIEVEATREAPYSVDENLWGKSVECGVLEDAWSEPPDDVFSKRRGDESKYVDIQLKEGTPSALNGEALSFLQIVERLNEYGTLYGIGRLDVIEDRVVGIKSREVYEAPAAYILHIVYKAMEQLILDKSTLSFKKIVAHRYGELIYEGLWFTSLRKALDGFVQTLIKRYTGTVKVRLSSESARVVGRKSPYSLYKKELATYGEEDVFQHSAAEGFVKIFGLPYEGGEDALG